MKTTPLAYSYQRFSSPEQGKGDSLRRQDAALQSFLDRNGLKLDDSLRFVDAGISGFRGKHRADDTTALGYFLSLVQSGRVPSGSYLIVESLDRISREEVKKALKLLLGLLEAGVRVVQLQPTEVIYDSDTDPMKLIIAIVELSRGNSESQMKSVRIGAAWDRKRKAARESGTAMTKLCPKWLRRSGDGYELIPERVAVVQRIFRSVADGYGLVRVCQQLDADGVATFGRSKRWNEGTVHAMVTGRSVLGEYQPRKGGVADGPPIRGYFPAAVDEELYDLAQAGIRERSNFQGRVSTPLVNLFSGLLFSAIDGDPLSCRNQSRTKIELRRYCNSSSRTATRALSFPVAAFEEGVLQKLLEIDPNDIAAPDSATKTTAKEIADQSRRLSTINGQIANIKAAILAGSTATTYNKMIADLEEQRDDAIAKLDAAKKVEDNVTSDSIGQCKSLIDALRDADDKELARLRLRSVIRRLISRIDVLAAKSGRREVALIQLHFRDRDRKRSVLVFYRGELNSGGIRRQPAFLDVDTRIDGLLKSLDVVRDRGQVELILRDFVVEAHWHRHVEPARPTASEVRRRSRKARYYKTLAGTSSKRKRKSR